MVARYAAERERILVDADRLVVFGIKRSVDAEPVELISVVNLQNEGSRIAAITGYGDPRSVLCARRRTERRRNDVADCRVNEERREVVAAVAINDRYRRNRFDDVLFGQLDTVENITEGIRSCRDIEYVVAGLVENDDIDDLTVPDQLQNHTGRRGCDAGRTNSA